MKPFHKHALIILFFVALTILFTYPLVTDMGQSMVGEIGDNIYFVWMIGWMKRALFDLHVNPFDVWFLNYPEGWNMAYTEITPAQLALALPFSFINATFAYNAALMLTFVLSGYIMYLWVRHLTGSDLPGLIAGTIFAFIPYHMAHFLIGHLNLSGTQWLPLFFWGLIDLLRWEPAEKKMPWRAVLLAGIGLGLIALTSQYYLYMGLFIAAFVGVVSLFLNRGAWKNWRFWRNLAVAGAVSLPLVLAAVLPYVQLSRSGGLPDRDIALARMYSASPTDFLLPSTDHFALGQWVGDHFNRENWVEGTLYFGAVTLILAAVAIFTARRSGRARLVFLLLAGSALAVLLAMGTELHWNGQVVEVPTPAFLKQWVSSDPTMIPLPGRYLFYHFPYYAKMRALMRFGVFALLLVAAVAGLGAEQLLKRKKHGVRLAFGALLITLVLLDFYPGPYRHLAKVETRPVDAWLAEQPGQGAVVQFPFEKGEDQDQTYNTLIHGKPFVGGFFNAFPPAQYLRIKPVLISFPSEEGVALLRELGVQWVLVDGASYEDMPAYRDTAEGFGLTYVDTFEDQWVFELDSE